MREFRHFQNKKYYHVEFSHIISFYYCIETGFMCVGGGVVLYLHCQQVVYHIKYQLFTRTI